MRRRRLCEPQRVGILKTHALPEKRLGWRSFCGLQTGGPQQKPPVNQWAAPSELRGRWRHARDAPNEFLKRSSRKSVKMLMSDISIKFAVLGDIHANLEALLAVLSDARDQGCSHYACVGDIVGYNANPGECLDIVREMGMPCVKGNHDRLDSGGGGEFEPSRSRGDSLDATTIAGIG